MFFFFIFCFLYYECHFYDNDYVESLTHVYSCPYFSSSCYISTLYSFLCKYMHTRSFLMCCNGILFAAWQAVNYSCSAGSCCTHTYTYAIVVGHVSRRVQMSFFFVVAIFPLSLICDVVVAVTVSFSFRKR